MDINDVKLNWKERTDVLSKMIRTLGKQKTAEQIDGFIDNNKSIWPNAYGIITIFPSGWGAPTIKHEHGVSNIVPVISNEFDNGNYTVNIDFESNAYYECETIDSMEITTSFV